MEILSAEANINSVNNFFNYIYDPDISSTEYKFLMLLGSQNEDKGGLINYGISIGSRYANHFYDPKTGEGIKNAAIEQIYQQFVGQLPVDSITWALDLDRDLQSNPIHFVGGSLIFEQNSEYSWTIALEKANNMKFDYAYIALGHILHLLHDLTVPAHTRNDSHIFGDEDFYESRVEEILKTEVLTIAKNLVADIPLPSL